MGQEYIKIDNNGYWYNSEFMPDHEKYGSEYNGYKNDNQNVLFYYFAVLGYDISFEYNNNTYYFLFADDHVARCNENFNEQFEVFENANEMIKSFSIDGKKLIDLIDELKNADTY